MSVIPPDLGLTALPALLQSSVAWVLLGLFMVLIVSSVLVRVLHLRHPEKDDTELRSRVKTWWVLVGLVTLSLLSGRTGSILLWLLVSYLAFKEYLSLVPTRRADHRVHEFGPHRHGGDHRQLLWHRMA